MTVANSYTWTKFACSLYGFLPCKFRFEEIPAFYGSVWGAGISDSSSWWAHDCWDSLLVEKTGGSRKSPKYDHIVFVLILKAEALLIVGENGVIGWGLEPGIVAVRQPGRGILLSSAGGVVEMKLWDLRERLEQKKSKMWGDPGTD